MGYQTYLETTYYNVKREMYQNTQCPEIYNHSELGRWSVDGDEDILEHYKIDTGLWCSGVWIYKWNKS